mmetsp:Transcript_12455/g.33571  ORF Transcript_12455/g.33571 Transcript_12455/m.33571 type:complete len:271 (-) Transcript_12455:120-932(-)
MQLQRVQAAETLQQCRELGNTIPRSAEDAETVRILMQVWRQPRQPVAGKFDLGQLPTRRQRGDDALQAIDIQIFVSHVRISGRRQVQFQQVCKLAKVAGKSACEPVVDHLQVNDKTMLVTRHSIPKVETRVTNCPAIRVPPILSASRLIKRDQHFSFQLPGRVILPWRTLRCTTLASPRQIWLVRVIARRLEVDAASLCPVPRAVGKKKPFVVCYATETRGIARNTQLHQRHQQQPSNGKAPRLASCRKTFGGASPSNSHLHRSMAQLQW